MAFKADYGTVSAGDYVVVIEDRYPLTGFTHHIGKMLEDGRIAVETNKIKKPTSHPLCRIDDELVPNETKEILDRIISKLPTFRYFMVTISNIIPPTRGDYNTLVIKCRISTLAEDASEAEIKKKIIACVKKHHFNQVVTKENISFNEVGGNTYYNSPQGEYVKI